MHAAGLKKSPGLAIEDFSCTRSTYYWLRGSCPYLGSLAVMKASVILARVCALVIGLGSAQAATITHLYDFEGATPYTGGPLPVANQGITQSGWTHMDTSIAGTSGTPGFVGLLGVGSNNSYLRASSVQSPTDVTIDFIEALQTVAGPGNPALVFRDIAPAWASSVQLTIYISSPGDFYNAAGTTLNLIYNGGTPLSVPNNTASAGLGTGYWLPITATIDLNALNPASGGTKTLDFSFMNTSGVAVRVNGIDAVYTVPEPAAAGLAGLGLCVLMLRRRTRRVC